MLSNFNLRSLDEISSNIFLIEYRDIAEIIVLMRETKFLLEILITHLDCKMSGTIHEVHNSVSMIF